MFLQLYIKGQLIEGIELEFQDCITFTMREIRVQEFASYLRNKFSQDLFIYKDWEIILLAYSKMNSKTPRKTTRKTNN